MFVISIRWSFFPFCTAKVWRVFSWWKYFCAFHLCFLRQAYGIATNGRKGLGKCRKSCSRQTKTRFFPAYGCAWLHQWFTRLQSTPRLGRSKSGLIALEQQLSAVDQHGIHIVHHANRLITLTVTLIVEVYGSWLPCVFNQCCASAYNLDTASSVEAVPNIFTSLYLLWRFTTAAIPMLPDGFFLFRINMEAKLQKRPIHPNSPHIEP